MLKEAIEYLMKSGKPEVLYAAGQTFTTNKAERIYEPIVDKPFNLTTLTGIVDYINSKVDTDMVGHGMIVHIESPTSVSIYAELNEDKRRELLVNAKAIVPELKFGTYMDVESFIVEVMSKYEKTEDSTNILRLVGNIREEHVQNTSDNGITQTVTAKKGIATVEQIDVPNPIILAPYRSFPEIDQPTSKFIFRLQDGPKAALFNAGGTLWRVEAMQGIKTFLEDQIMVADQSHVRIIM